MEKDHIKHSVSLTLEEFQKRRHSINTAFYAVNVALYKHIKKHSASFTGEELQKHRQAIHAAIHRQINKSSQNFFYPKSQVLKNKYGLTNSEKLKEQCAHNVRQEMLKLLQEPPPEQFDSSYLKHLHKRLFHHTYEWAGHTRDNLFTFSDGTLAFTPVLKEKNFTKPFATGKKIQEGLQNLDKLLTEQNNLQGLTREEFIEHAAKIMINLHSLHPFRKGNGCTIQLFIEKLAKAAGHSTDFSLVTKKRRIFVHTCAMNHNDSKPMEHLLEDLSNPEKTPLLMEFINSIKALNLDEKSDHLATIAQEGHTYHGIYRGSGKNYFMVEVNGTLILSHKKNLTSEQVEALTIGDTLSFTVPKTQKLQKKEQTTKQIFQPSSLKQTQKGLTTLQINETLKNDITTDPIKEQKFSSHPKSGHFNLKSKQGFTKQGLNKKAKYSPNIAPESVEAALPSLTEWDSLLKIYEKDISPRNFFYPNNITLKNKYGIKDYKQLQMQCAHDSVKATINLRQEAPPQRLTSTYLFYIHHTLFKNTFEWAGQTREKPFTFADGTIACMPEMKKDSLPFAQGGEIQERLKNFDQTLIQKNHLKDLTREAFVENAAEMMLELNYTHPFREGNGRTQRLFFEKLAEVAGHKLDFSLVTTQRMTVASMASRRSNDSQPMKYLFDDISDPEKTIILKEFMDHMKKIDPDHINHRVVITAKEGETYTGFYRGSGNNGFMVDVHGTFVIGRKDNLPPEQVKTLKIGDTLSFTVPRAQNVQKTLIPGEKKTPLTKSELAESVYNNVFVQEAVQKIEHLCKIVYGNQHALQNKIPPIKIPVSAPNIAASERFAQHIAIFPHTLHKLCGFKLCGIKNRTRVHAEENILPLSHAILDYIDAIKQAEKNILQNNQKEQQHYQKEPIEIPSQWMQDLLALSKEQQEEVLSKSPEQRAEINLYIKRIHKRLSPSEHEAIKDNHYENLAKMLGISTNKAKEIIETVKSIKEIQQSLSSSFHTNNAQLAQNLQHLMKKSHDEKQINSLVTSAMKEEKTAESIKKKTAMQHNISPHQSENVKVIAMI
ncbi:BID domain-containing T4SS effector [Bartonella rattaustraliani]|uniref:BID domain-containing T4SS effector n=1 Tax=Bartonella rattaustraliani TaxID=481139 RepID=UPI0003091FC5|nr:BID domain-containing T4SS effector [Bartonella rattaustraliani]